MTEFLNVVDAMPGDVFLVACMVASWLASGLGITRKIRSGKHERYG